MLQPALCHCTSRNRQRSVFSTLFQKDAAILFQGWCDIVSKGCYILFQKDPTLLFQKGPTLLFQKYPTIQYCFKNIVSKGNDLARVLRWGPGYGGDEDPLSLLRDVIDAEEIRLDRWTVVFRPLEPAEGAVGGDGKGFFLTRFSSFAIFKMCLMQVPSHPPRQAKTTPKYLL